LIRNGSFRSTQRREKREEALRNDIAPPLQSSPARVRLAAVEETLIGLLFDADARAE